MSVADVLDTVSQANGNFDGLSYCGPRIYSLRLVEVGRFESQDKAEFITTERIVDSGPLVFEPLGKNLILDVGAEDIGRYQYVLSVYLDSFNALENPGSFSFYAYVLYDCSVS